MPVAQANLEIVRRIDRMLPMREAPTFEAAVNFSGSYQQPVHRWFRYREGFTLDELREWVAAGRP